MVERIGRVKDKSKRLELQAIWYILSGIRYGKEFLDRFLSKEVLMESTTYKAILEEGIEKGIEQGIEKGMEKGIAKGIEKGIEKGILTDILTMMEDRFGVIPLYVEERLKEVKGESSLRSLLRQTIKVDSIAEFMDKIGQILAK